MKYNKELTIMKKYNSPEIEIIVLSAEDIITLSVDLGIDNEDYAVFIA